MRMSVLAIVGLLLICVGWVLGLVLSGIGAVVWVILGLGAAFIAIAAIVDRRRVRDALVSRRGKFGLGSTVRIALFVGIILVANAISVRNNHRFDLTGLAEFTLTSQTKQVLVDLNTPVEVISFFIPSVPVTVSGYAHDLLSEYQNYSDQLTVLEIDPDMHPDQARQYGVDRLGALYGVVVFNSDEGQRRVYGPQISAEAEHAFTSALLEVTGIRQKTVYFLTGHGESTIYTDYSLLRSGLREQLFYVDELDLRSGSPVPEDAAVLVIAGPRQALTGNESRILQEYLEGGGTALVLLDPDPPEGFVQILSQWWLDIDDGMIVDPTSYVAPYADNPLVPHDRNNLQLAETYFPGATAVLPQAETPASVELEALVWTSTESWLETELVIGETPEFEEATERKGPFAIGAVVLVVPAAAAGEAGASNEARLIVFGDSDFAVNQHYPNGSNSELILSAINWLTAGKEIVSVDRKVLPVRRLVLSPEQASFLHLSSIVLLPLLLLIAGAYVWWRRR